MTEGEVKMETQSSEVRDRGVESGMGSQGIAKRWKEASWRPK